MDREHVRGTSRRQMAQSRIRLEK